MSVLKVMRFDHLLPSFEEVYVQTLRLAFQHRSFPTSPSNLRAFRGLKLWLCNVCVDLSKAHGRPLNPGEVLTVIAEVIGGPGTVGDPFLGTLPSDTQEAVLSMVEFIVSESIPSSEPVGGWAAAQGLFLASAQASARDASATSVEVATGRYPRRVHEPPAQVEKKVPGVPAVQTTGARRGAQKQGEVSRGGGAIQQEVEKKAHGVPGGEVEKKVPGVPAVQTTGARRGAQQDHDQDRTPASSSNSSDDNEMDDEDEDSSDENEDEDSSDDNEEEDEVASKGGVAIGTPVGKRDRDASWSGGEAGSGDRRVRTSPTHASPERLRNLLKESRDSVSRLIAEKTSLQSEVLGLQTKVHGLGAKVKRLEVALESAKRAREDLLEAAEERLGLKKQIKDLQAKMVGEKDVKKQAEAYRSDLDKARVQIETLEHQVAGWKASFLKEVEAKINKQAETSRKDV